jgi:hypothetical protein
MAQTETKRDIEFRPANWLLVKEQLWRKKSPVSDKTHEMPDKGKKVC